MRCNWFTKASCLSQIFATSVAFRRVASRPTLFSCSGTACISPRFSYTRISFTRTYASSHALNTTPTSSETSFSPSHDYSYSRSPLTAIQISREAWKSTRLALQADDVTTALIIGEAVRLSNKPRHSLPSRRLLSAALEFPIPVPQRLTSHAVLHGLIRLGHIRRANIIANILIDNGVRLHNRTMELIIHKLVELDGSPGARGREFFLHLKSLLPKKDVMFLHPTSSPRSGTNTAIRLLQAARNYKQYRSERMFYTIINSCLLHGELLAATLLFTAIVRDCALREALSRKLHSPTISEDPVTESRTLEHFRHLKIASGFTPSIELFRGIVKSIADTLSVDFTDPEDEAQVLTIRAALQALANLAVLLDFRQLPFRDVGNLIRALYNCPKVNDYVWIVDKKGKPIRVKAYSYFHSVLYRLIIAPPTDERKPHLINLNAKGLPSWLPSYSVSFSFNTRSYNALLHYSLRHRLSPRLANRVLEHMKAAPSDFTSDPRDTSTTYNILLDAGKILRASSYAENTLQLLRKQRQVKRKEQEETNDGPENRPSNPDEVEIPTIHSRPMTPEPVLDLDMSGGASQSRFSRALRELAKEAIDVPLPSSVLRTDQHTLSSYITYLVATGRPHLVADLLFELLPELSIVDHPAWGPLTPMEARVLRRQSRQKCLERVVGYGPYFFVAMLNAVVKAGRTGLAERVWHLAKEAERASWISTINTKGRPWCLPVHAYTLMLTCYANEARKPVDILKASTEEAIWKPQSKRYAVGWAGYVLRQSKKSGHLKRPVAGRASGALIYNSMFAAARLVYNTLQRLQQEGNSIPPGIEVPRPDARFFNAMLRISTFHTMVRSRRARTSASHWRRHIGFAKFLFARYGQTHKYLNVYVQGVAKDIARAGLPVPIGLRYLLIGSDMGPQRIIGHVKPLRRGPWAYPVSKKLVNGPFSLFTEKQKGLPLGRVSRKIRLKSCTRSNGNV